MILGFIGTVWWTIICVAAGGTLALGFRPLILKWIKGKK
tara:strand:+ start:934 stop:1050 length:117 start_codon:yes stop_codon:yes gene_type:complete